MSKLAIFCLFFLAHFLPAYADIEDLDLVVIEASKEASRFDLSTPVIIEESTLTNRPQPQLASVIETIPGIVGNQNGGPGSRVSFFIRGTESRHVSFTLDGLKLNDVSNNDRQFDAAFLTAPFLSQINVFKGPQAVLYGSDALGGLVDLRTRKGENAPETRLNVHAGSFGTYGGSLSSDWGRKGNSGTLTVFRGHSDGLSRLNEKRFKAKERDSSDITNLISSSSHEWSKNKTDLLFGFIEGRNELDNFSSDSSYDRSKNQQYLGQQKTSHRFSKTMAISLRNGINRHQRFIHDSSNGKPSYTGNLIQNELIVEMRHSMGEVLAGIASDKEEFQQSSQHRSFDLHSVYLQSLWQLGNVSAQAGMRNDWHTRFGNFTTGTAGLSHQWKELKTFIQYSQGYKAPSLYQLYDPLYGNRDLTPERNHSWQGGWTYEKDSYGFEATLFRNRLTGLFATDSNLVYRNQRRFISEGVDLGARTTWQKWMLRLGYVHQDFKNEESVILGRPRNSLSVQVSHFVNDRVELWTRYRSYDARYGYGTSDSVKLNGFEVVDVGARLEHNKNEYSVQIVNLFDRDYEELYGYSVMPRSVFAGYGRKF